MEPNIFRMLFSIKNQKLMENSILKIIGSVDVKIIPDFYSQIKVIFWKDRAKSPKLKQNIAVSMKLFTLDYVVNEDLHLLVF